MQKILFSKCNTVKIDIDVAKVVHVYNQLSDATLNKIMILNALSKLFGYNNWSNLKAVNKEDRYYVPFSFRISSHVRHFVDELSAELNVDAESLMVAVTLVELNVEDLQQILVVNQKQKSIKKAFFTKSKDLNTENHILWFTEDLNHVTKNLIYHSITGIRVRDGLFLKHLKLIFPELGHWLQRSLKLSDDFVLLFKDAIWWTYADYFKHKQQHKVMLELQVKSNNKSGGRSCYYPIYNEKPGCLLKDISEAFAETPPFCQDTSHFDTEMTDIDYISASLETWEKGDDIAEISLLVTDSLIHNLISQYPSKKFVLLTDEIANFVNRADNFDFTFSVSTVEPRYEYIKSNRKIMKEPWILDDDSNKFILLNELIYAELQELARTRDCLAEDIVVDRYYKQKFRQIYQL